MSKIVNLSIGFFHESLTRLIRKKIFNFTELTEEGSFITIEKYYNALRYSKIDKNFTLENYFVSKNFWYVQQIQTLSIRYGGPLIILASDSLSEQSVQSGNAKKRQFWGQIYLDIQEKGLFLNISFWIIQWMAMFLYTGKK